MNETRKKRFINATLNIIMKNRPLLLILCATVVFVTTYLLILPAVTLEEQEAAKQGGIDVPSAELTFEGAGYAVRASYDAKAGLPENTELAAVEIGKDDEDYQAWHDEALKAVQDGAEPEPVFKKLFEWLQSDEDEFKLLMNIHQRLPIRPNFGLGKTEDDTDPETYYAQVAANTMLAIIIRSWFARGMAETPEIMAKISADIYKRLRGH